MNRKEYENGLTIFATSRKACKEVQWLLDEPIDRETAETTLEACLTSATFDLADATGMTAYDSRTFVDNIVAAARLQIKLDLQAYLHAHGALWLPVPSSASGAGEEASDG